MINFLKNLFNNKPEKWKIIDKVDMYEDEDGTRGYLYRIYFLQSTRTGLVKSTKVNF